ncbi:hypothetical protein JL720_10004 [Aureococcus anophagefferens]|nr:hypothetical protein JL720_10004 [Aureococcus anophagefferens]
MDSPRRNRSAPPSGANWKKRYFVLNGSSLVYYETHKKMDDAKGDLLLTVGCEVSDVDEPKRQFCFEISTNNEALRLSATSEAERDAWKAAIADTVSLLGSTCQSYLSIDVRGVFGTKAAEKFSLKAQRDDRGRRFALTSSALYKAEDKYSLEALNVYLMEPTCSVYHTRLYANAARARRAAARTASAKNNWKERYFVLKESKLSYYTSKDDEESLKDRIHLMGSRQRRDAPPRRSRRPSARGPRRRGAAETDAALERAAVEAAEAELKSDRVVRAAASGRGASAMALPAPPDAAAPAAPAAPPDDAAAGDDGDDDDDGGAAAAPDADGSSRCSAPSALADGNLKFELDLFHEFDVAAPASSRRPSSRAASRGASRATASTAPTSFTSSGVRHYKRGTV